MMSQSMRNCRWLGLLIAVLWVLAGPIAMAFGGCAVMGGMCEAPCGAGAYAFQASPEQPILPLVVVLPESPTEFIVNIAIRVPALPPRTSPLSASLVVFPLNA